MNRMASVEDKLQEILDEFIDAHETPPGAVLLIETPSFKWVGAAGLANVNEGIRIKPTDRLRIASMTKTFVGATVLKLSEEGKFALDDQIKEHLSDGVVRDLANGSDITIRQLMNMTSGLYNYTCSKAYDHDLEKDPFRRKWEPEEILKYVYGKKALFPPGSSFEYSNTNYILLGMIVEQASGESLSTTMRRVIHDPLGLENTFMEKPEHREGGPGGLIVRGYEEKKDVTKINDALGMADGGLISDAQGLSDFLRALFKDKTLLSQASLDQMLAFHPSENYGLGVDRSSLDNGDGLGHDGASAGFEGAMYYFPGNDIFFVLLTNEAYTDTIYNFFMRTMNMLL